MKKILVVFGTRPEAIKLAPVIIELKKCRKFDVNVCVTAQHRQMLDQVLEIFNIIPGKDLGLMKPNQTLSSLSSRAMESLDKYYNSVKPDLVLVQGDTTTAFIASLTAFYNKIKIGHVEAGLRTWNKNSPFPEEVNRVLVTKIADFHFAPTESSKINLLKDGIKESDIFVTGNTVIDSLLYAKNKLKKKHGIIQQIPREIKNLDSNNIILITGHRRENFGEGFRNICEAIGFLAKKFPHLHFVYPVHLNPNVRQPVHKLLSSYDNIHLISPLDYLPFVFLMARAKIILTDSGGIQEEAPSFGKPVLVMRENTERPEAVDAGTVKIVGTKKKTIIEETEKLIMDKNEYLKMVRAINPYGDGFAAKRIKNILLQNVNNFG